MGEVVVEQLDHGGRRQWRLLARLADDGVADDQVGGDVRAGDGDGVVPRKAQRGHPSTHRHHPVGGGSCPLQGATPVQRAELGVLLESADARFYPTTGVAQRLATLSSLEQGDGLDLGPQPCHTSFHQRGTLGGSGALPHRVGGSGGGDQLPGVAARQLGDGRARRGVGDVDDGHGALGAQPGGVLTLLPATDPAGGGEAARRAAVLARQPLAISVGRR